MAFSKLMESQYGYAAGRGYIDLPPGMRVSATRAYFSGSAINLGDYLGAETGRWTIEPGPRFRFVGATSEPGLRKPASEPSIDKLVDARVRRQRFYRMFFQVRWLGGGREDARGSVILGAADAAALDEATAALLSDKMPACGARLECIPFPPATTVTAEVGVEVNGEKRWVAWGSTPRSLAPPSARASLRVERRLGRSYAPVEFARDDDEAWRFPVLPGDRLLWASEAGAAAVAERVVTTSDGVSAPIAFDTRGNGAIALVFIHGWASDRSFWHEQADVFAREGYRVVTLDLTGHGPFAPSSPPRFVLGLAADVEAVVRDLGLRRVILIGHSMGGPIALAAAKRLQGIARGVVLVDHGIPAASADLEADFQGAMARMVRSQFAAGVNDRARDFVIERAVKADRATALNLLRNYREIDLGALLAGAAVPIRAINASPAQIELARRQTPQTSKPSTMPGAGHFPHLERPAAFNALLRKILIALQ